MAQQPAKTYSAKQLSDLYNFINSHSRTNSSLHCTLIVKNM